jgi:hypothetical protein
MYLSVADSPEHTQGGIMIDSAEIITPLTPESLTTQIADLKNEIAQAREAQRLADESLQAMTDKYNQLRATVNSDCGILSDELIGQANERGWCEVYDRIVSNVNNAMQVVQIREREQEWEIQVTISGRFAFNSPVVVTAASREQAVENINDDLHSYIDVDDAVSEYIKYNLDTSDFDIEVDA